MRKITKLESQNAQPIRRKRVAAYARVSSGKDAQIHSLSAQISYYNNYIGSRGDWEFAGIYADEAMTGTKENRPQFQKLLADCRAGKIDMVIAKSITRLARNTVTLLETARELKSLGIDIYFEKENIHTLSTDGELMLTLLASFAQEESRSVSENVKWRIRKNFEKGIPNGGSMLGYRFEDGMLQVVPEEAEIVKQIFDDFLSGMGRSAIVRKLNSMGLTTKQGNLWSITSVYNILRNDKYTGNLLLQTTYTVDHISKKTVRNNGELPMYYVEDSHEAIIEQDTFERAQQEMKRRAEKFYHPSTRSEPYLFTGLLCCGICGKRYRRRIVHQGSKYRKAAWICRTFDTCGKEACQSQQIPESILVAKTSELLEINDLDRTILLEHIRKIQVPRHNTLIYVFNDGHTEEVTWQNPSRRESWNDSMKQSAREKQKKVMEQKRNGEEK